MGRIQTFDTQVVVQAARDVFWDKGYEATTVAELVAATGLNRSSLYHAFGDKRGLFEQAVDDYLDTVIRPRLRPLLAGDSGEVALLRYFEGLRTAVAALPPEAPRRGCLLVDCATGLAGYDEAARMVVDGYRAELSDAIRAALNAIPGAVATSPRRDDQVSALSSLSISAMVLARVNREEAIALLTTAIGLTRIWTVVG